jgi:anti-sigma regulatory factor (Ser/Thr protein kinase)
MESNRTLNLSLAAEPESVGVARRAVGDLAEGLGVEEPQLGDLKTVVSEASANVVRHAYPSGPGTFELEARPVEGELAVVVRDFGRGMQGRDPAAGSRIRLGLGLISLFSNRYEIVRHRRGGTELRVTLPLRGPSRGRVPSS